MQPSLEQDVSPWRLLNAHVGSRDFSSASFRYVVHG